MTGYEENEDLEGHCFGGIFIQMLNTDGSNVLDGDGFEVYYRWIDDGDREAGWYSNGEELIENADEILFPCGQGLCFNLDGDYIGCKVIAAGQVVEGQVSYLATEEGTNHFVGNPLARAVKLSELSVTGYEENEDLEGHCFGGIFIQMLNTDGSNVLDGDGFEVYYRWIDDGDRVAGWYSNGEEPIENADEIEFGVGDGMTLNFDGDYVGCSLVFPSLGLK